MTHEEMRKLPRNPKKMTVAESMEDDELSYALDRKEDAKADKIIADAIKRGQLK